MEEMEPEETRYDCSVYWMNKEKDGWRGKGMALSVITIADRA